MLFHVNFHYEAQSKAIKFISDSQAIAVHAGVRDHHKRKVCDRVERSFAYL